MNLHYPIFRVFPKELHHCPHPFFFYRKPAYLPTGDFFIDDLETVSRTPLYLLTYIIHVDLPFQWWAYRLFQQLVYCSGTPTQILESSEEVTEKKISCRLRAIPNSDRHTHTERTQ